MVLYSHPTGNANVRAAVLGLHNAGILNEFHTSVATFPNSFLDYLSKLGPLSEFRRRSFHADLQAVTKMHPFHELGRFASSKAGLHTLIKHETGYFSIDSVYRNLDRAVSKRLRSYSERLKGVYSYEDGAFFTFREAKRLGVPCIYDLPIGYWRVAQTLMDGEKEKWPEWAPTLVGIKNSEEKLERKDKELEMADKIFVASKFTASTLSKFPSALAPVEVIPYGFPPVNAQRSYEKITSNRPLRLLFVGGLSQRKGIADLFEAVKPLEKHIELTLVGRKATDECKPLNDALKRHKWIPTLAHSEVLRLMSQSDVLVFPSLFEGFGLVITEAMSQGTPVITTERTAGPDLINSGVNGWLVEAGSSLALRATIEELLYKPELIENAGYAARKTAGGRPWSVYGSELAASIRQHLV